MILENGSDEAINDYCHWVNNSVIITRHNLIGFVKIENEKDAESVLAEAGLKVEGMFLGLVRSVVDGDTTYYVHIPGIGALAGDYEDLTTKQIIVRNNGAVEFKE